MNSFIGTLNTHRNSDRFFADHPIIDKKLINLLKRGVKACKEWSYLKGENESDDCKEYHYYMNFLLKEAKKRYAKIE